MKRLLFFMLCIMLLLVGCKATQPSDNSQIDNSQTDNQSEPSNESSEAGGEVSEPEQQELTEPEFEWCAIRIGGYEPIEPRIIKSVTELSDDFSALGYPDISGTSLSKYDDSYFETNQLVIITYVEGSGSISHEVKKLRYDGETLSVEVKRVSPNWQTNDMAEWQIIIELSKDIAIGSAENIKVETYTMPSESVESAQMRFALALFKDTVASQNEQQNVLVSPLSVQLALSMTANGANGKTLDEMQSLLSGEHGLEALNDYNRLYLSWLPKDEKSRLHIANSIWIRNDGSVQVKDEFLNINKDYYQSSVYKKPFDEQTVKDINSWVNENTEGMIDKIIDRIDDNTVMYLINALAFDAEWQEIYSEDQIFNGTFTAIDGTDKTVPMMHSEERYYLQTENAVGFRKDYKNSRFSFVAVLPNEGIEIDDYIASLDEKSAYQILYGLKRDCCEVTMPKFKAETEITLNETLKRLGMPAAFETTTADFSGMAFDGNLYIGKVLHKTFIQVDERGTKAGAVTSVAMDSEGVIMIENKVVLDRPFIYMIIDNETGLPIFIGVQKLVD